MNNTEISENYQKILSLLPAHVQLVAVSKTHPVQSIQKIYEAGQRVFGENKVQEIVEKQALLPKDIQWHLIGHLQTNKVKYIAEFVDTIQSVDSEKLLEEINKQALKHQRIIKVLLQVKIAEEETKFGLEIHETKEIFLNYMDGKYSNIEITGLMGMATFTEDRNQVKKRIFFVEANFRSTFASKKTKNIIDGNE